MSVVHEASLGCASQDGSATVDGADAEAALVVALEAFISTDTRGRVLAWNPAAEQAFGWCLGEACGETLEELIIAAESRPAYRAAVAPLTTPGGKHVAGQRVQLDGRHRDGRIFPMEVALSVTRRGRGYRLHVFARDITARQRAQRFAGAQAAVSRVLAEATGTTEATAGVVAAVADTLLWPVVELWLVDPAHAVLACAARQVSAGRDADGFILDELEAGVGVPGAAWAGGGALWVPDLTTDTRYLRPGIGAPTDLRVAVAVPFGGGDDTAVTGVMVCYGDRAEDPEDTLLALLSGIAAHVGQFLHRRRAEELDLQLASAKDDLLALVTHELRNPLAIIVSCINLLQDELDDLSSQQQQQYLQTVHRGAERLTALIDDLLDLALLESGQFVLQWQDTDLCQIIDDAVADLEPAIDDKHLRLQVAHPDCLHLRGDGHRLRQVADNLLSNAVKYTPDGGTVTITAALDDDTVDWTVTDTGIGIPAADRAKLFQRFYRASTALATTIPGTGLGLAITRTIVERHHGSIDLVDQPGSGTTFEIRLPAQQQGDTRSASTSPC